MKLNLLGFIRFSGFSSSTKIPRRAQAATKPIRGSALGAATVNRATITAMPARHTCHKEAIRDSEQKMQKQLQRTQYQNYSGSVNNKYYSFWVTIYYLDPLATSFLIQNG